MCDFMRKIRIFLNFAVLCLKCQKTDKDTQYRGDKEMENRNVLTASKKMIKTFLPNRFVQLEYSANKHYDYSKENKYTKGLGNYEIHPMNSSTQPGYTTMMLH